MAKRTFSSFGKKKSPAEVISETGMKVDNKVVCAPVYRVSDLGEIESMLCFCKADVELTQKPAFKCANGACGFYMSEGIAKKVQRKIARSGTPFLAVRICRESMQMCGYFSEQGGVVHSSCNYMCKACAAPVDLALVAATKAHLIDDVSMMWLTSRDHDKASKERLITMLEESGFDSDAIEEADFVLYENATGLKLNPEGTVSTSSTVALSKDMREALGEEEGDGIVFSKPKFSSATFQLLQKGFGALTSDKEKPEKPEKAEKAEKAEKPELKKKAAPKRKKKEEEAETSQL